MTYTTEVIALLKQGLDYIQQGRDTEGIALLESGRRQLATTQTRIANVLEIFISSYLEYQHAWQTLQEASIRFAKAHAEQQVHTRTLTELLPALLQELENSLTVPTSMDTMSSTSAISLPAARAAHEVTTPVLSISLKSPDEKHLALPALFITCFRQFEVKRTGQPLKLCASRKGQSILRYLVAQPEHSATIDTLMTLLWPDDEPEVAQGKLHVAICVLRRSLNSGYPCDPGAGYILCNNHSYMLNPAVSIQTDVEQFVQAFQTGRNRVKECLFLYERACHLYTGPFLSEDLYADWSFLQREQLSQMYLIMCRALADAAVQHGNYEGAIPWINAILKENRCDEEAHCQLIRVYTLQERRSEAIEQYQRCERILRKELGIKPLPETTNLFHTLLSH